MTLILPSLFSIWRRYKFESNSQLTAFNIFVLNCCFQYDEDTSSKAIHNSHFRPQKSVLVVFNMTKIQVRKQFTTFISFCFCLTRCFQYDEDTSSKAIHNIVSFKFALAWVVFNMTKIQVRKQFTTFRGCFHRRHKLFSIWRRYKFESNSQHYTRNH